MNQKKNKQIKEVPDKDILLFRSCLVSVEYPGVEASTKFVFDKLCVDYAISPKQTCCTGLGHYSDVFNQIDTSAIGARNFKIAKEMNRPNLVMMCATCYAINKKSVKLLNSKDKFRNHINRLFEENGLDHLKYEKNDLKPSENIFHVVDILYAKKDKIKEHIKYDLSDYTIATHHGCHYCKVHYEDTIGGVRDPNVMDELIAECGCKTIGWYDHKRATCGTGFRQRYSNPDLSFTATADKMNSIEDEDVDILVHLCPNCHIQFDRYQNLIGKREGRKFKAIHLNIAQFIALAMGADLNKTIGAKAHTIPIDSIIKDLKEVKESTKDTNKKDSKEVKESTKDTNKKDSKEVKESKKDSNKNPKTKKSTKNPNKKDSKKVKESTKDSIKYSKIKTNHSDKDKTRNELREAKNER